MTIDQYANCRDAYVDISTSHKDLPALVKYRAALCFEDGASYGKHMWNIASSCKMVVSPGTETASARPCALVSQFHL